MRLPHGTLMQLEKVTGLPKSNLSAYAAARRRPSRQRAIDLAEACESIGLDVAPEVWLFGTPEDIKTRLATAAKANEAA